MPYDTIFCIVCKKIDESVSHHNLPKCVEIRKKWMDILNLKEGDVNVKSKVCGLHFDAESYSKTSIIEPRLLSGTLPVRRFVDTDVKPPSITNRFEKVDESCDLPVVLFDNVTCVTKYLKPVVLISDVTSRDENLQIFDDTICHSAKERKRIGDFEPVDFSSPERASKNLSLMKNKIAQKNKQIHALTQAKRRLLKKVVMLEKLISHLKSKKS